MALNLLHFLDLFFYFFPRNHKSLMTWVQLPQSHYTNIVFPPIWFNFYYFFPDFCSLFKLKPTKQTKTIFSFLSLARMPCQARRNNGFDLGRAWIFFLPLSRQRIFVQGKDQGQARHSLSEKFSISRPHNSAASFPNALAALHGSTWRHGAQTRKPIRL